jgi:site-specific recombinase XerD
MGYVLSSATAELYEAFLESEKRRVSAQGYTTLLGITKRFLLWLEAEDLAPEDLGITDAVRFASCLAERSRPDGAPISTGTMHNYLKVARRFYDWMVHTERVKTNPFAELRYPRLPEHLSRNVLSEAQMACLLRELGSFDELPIWYERERRYRVHVIAEFLYATGLRIAEACSLTPENLDLEHRLVYVPSGKGGKPRTAFLTGYAAAVMARYLSTGRAVIVHHFTRGHEHTLFGAGKARVAEVVNGELRSVCAALELPIITSHGFRHSLGTHLLRSGCDMRHIQAILGHEAIGTTQIYTRVEKEDLKKSLDEYHPRHWQRPPTVAAASVSAAAATP